MRLTFRCLLIFALATFAFWGSPAFAQITVSLTSDGAPIAPGSSFTLSLSILNQSGEDLIVVSSNGNSSSTELTIDDSAFQTDLPTLTITPNATYSQNLLVFSSAAASGPFEISYSVEMQGVSSGTIYPGTGTAPVIIGGGGGLTAPEPTTIGFLALGVAFWGGASRRPKKH